MLDLALCLFVLFLFTGNLSVPFVSLAADRRVDGRSEDVGVPRAGDAVDVQPP
jgi:hypothetical protein